MSTPKQMPTEPATSTTGSDLGMSRLCSHGTQAASPAPSTSTEILANTILCAAFTVNCVRCIVGTTHDAQPALLSATERCKPNRICPLHMACATHLVIMPIFGLHGVARGEYMNCVLHTLPGPSWIQRWVYRLSVRFPGRPPSKL